MKSLKVLELEKLITKYSNSYYTGTAEVSDEYFDSLVDELKSLDPENKLLHTTGWGFVPSTHKERVVHPYGLKVGSLDKYKVVEEVRKHFIGYPFGIERISAKLDGLSVVSYYKNGRRTLCLTRGNETEGGLNITEHMDKICPEGKYIPDFSGAIRGEVCISNKSWKKSKYYKDSLSDSSINQRNIAAGLINRDYITEDEASILDYVVYKIPAIENRYFTRILDVDRLLSLTKLKMVDCIYPDNTFLNCINEDLLKKYYQEFCENYPCDGLVLTGQVSTSNNVVEYDEVAFKFQAESKIVTVTGVEYSATRTGRLVPVVLFKPTTLSGAVVRRATGFNALFIKENKINKGAKIEVCRSGEVIPHILKVVETADEPALVNACPHCGATPVWKGVDLVCNNENESQMPYNALTVLASLKGAGYRIYSGIVDAFDLTSLKNFENFMINLKNTNNIEDITRYIQEKSYVNGEHTFEEITKILGKLLKPINAVDALVACSIPGISDVVSRKIITEYPEIFTDVYTSLNKNILYNINGIGDRIINSLEVFKDRIKFMAENFYIEFPSKSEETSKVLFKVAITGKLSIKRSEFEEELRNAGYEPGGISKDTKYLITDNPNSSSSKNKKADEWGIMKITENEFRSKFMR